MGEAKVTAKCQLTVPADFRTEFGVEPGDKIYFFKRLDGQPGIKIVKPRKGAGFGMLKAYASNDGTGYSREEIGAAVAAGRDPTGDGS